MFPTDGKVQILSRLRKQFPFLHREAYVRKHGEKLEWL